MRWLTRSGLLEAAEASYAPDQVRDLIRQYGLPTPDYVVVEHEQDLSKVKLRFPVALKVCSPAILHKTEVGGVRLDIKNRAMLRREYERLKRVFPGEKFAVERMEKKGLEIIVGLTRDATFGLCIMLGLGGILTEALNDVIFRVLPINHADAEEMMKELKARCLLEGFRGMKVDREAIADLLEARGPPGVPGVCGVCGEPSARPVCRACVYRREAGLSVMGLGASGEA